MREPSNIVRRVEIKVEGSEEGTAASTETALDREAPDSIKTEEAAGTGAAAITETDFAAAGKAEVWNDNGTAPDGVTNG